MLDGFYITLHPQTQHRVTYSQDGSTNLVVEPTLALYCPIEGEDYVVEEAEGTREEGRSGFCGASWLPAQLDALVQVRLSSSACNITDDMRLTWPQAYSNFPTSRFVPGFFCAPVIVAFEVSWIGHGEGRWVFLTQTGSPLPIYRSPHGPRSPQIEQRVGVPQSRLKSF